MSHTKESIAGIVSAQRAYFRRGETLDVKFRKTQLKKLKQAVIDRQCHFYSEIQIIYSFMEHIILPMHQSYATSLVRYRWIFQVHQHARYRFREHQAKLLQIPLF